MTITRIFQEAFEIASADWYRINPWKVVDSNPGYTVSSQYTGNSAALFTSTLEGAVSVITSAISQMRAGMMFLVSSSAGTSSGIFFLGSGDLATPVLNIYYNDTTTTWYVYAGATELGNFSLDVGDNTWRHIGIDFKADASSGWCYVYIDGVAQLSYTGQTNQGASTFNLFGIGPVSSSYSGWSNLFIDDFYIDNTTGESSPVPAPKKRFFPLDPDGNGAYSQWYGTDGDQTNNYALIEYVTASSVNNLRFDGMLESKTSGHRDSWTLEATPVDITVSDDIPAVVIDTFAQTRDWNQQARLFTRHSSTNDDSDASTPQAEHGHYWARFATDPSGNSWTKTVLDALEIGIKFE